MFITVSDLYFYLDSGLTNLKLNGNPTNYYKLLRHLPQEFSLPIPGFCKIFRSTNLIIIAIPTWGRGKSRILVITYDNINTISHTGGVSHIPSEDFTSLCLE